MFWRCFIAGAKDRYALAVVRNGGWHSHVAMAAEGYHD